MKILHYQAESNKGSSLLLTPTIEVETIDKSIHQCIQNMHGVLRDIPYAVALAANQVNEKWRIFVYNHSKYEIKTVINPKITIIGEETIIDEEGCLSFPNLWLDIPRFKYINVKYVDFPSMKDQNQNFSDFTARIFQHECQHLDGRVFIDDLPAKGTNENLSRAT